MNRYRRAILTAGHALEKMDEAGLASEHAAEIRAVAQRPIHGISMNTQNALELIQQCQRGARGPIELVHEGKNRHAALPTDLEEFARLGLDALARVNHHD